MLTPPTIRIWLYGTRSYAVFDPGSPIRPDWMWRSRKFLDWIRCGAIRRRRDRDGDLLISPEVSQEDARRLRCWWVGLDIMTEGLPIPVYALLPWGRFQEVREALRTAERALAATSCG